MLKIKTDIKSRFIRDKFSSKFHLLRSKFKAVVQIVRSRSFLLVSIERSKEEGIPGSCILSIEGGSADEDIRHVDYISKITESVMENAAKDMQDRKLRDVITGGGNEVLDLAKNILGNEKNRN